MPEPQITVIAGSCDPPKGNARFACIVTACQRRGRNVCSFLVYQDVQLVECGADDATPGKNRTNTEQSGFACFTHGGHKHTDNETLNVIAVV